MLSYGAMNVNLDRRKRYENSMWDENQTELMVVREGRAGQGRVREAHQDGVRHWRVGLIVPGYVACEYSIK